MKDFRIVQARNLLKISSVAPIRGFSPASIVVIGANLDQTSEIIYNGILADEFIISSSTRLIVRIPPSQVGKDLTDIKIYSSRPTLNSDADLVLELTKPLKTVSGLDRLVQSWVMVFLTSPGSDAFTPQSGGGARLIIGSRTDRKQKSAAADLAAAIERTQAEIIRLQSKNPAIPPQERLLSSSLEAISADESTGVISARVLLKNMINQAANVSMG